MWPAASAPRGAKTVRPFVTVAWSRRSNIIYRNLTPTFAPSIQANRKYNKILQEIKLTSPGDTEDQMLRNYRIATYTHTSSSVLFVIMLPSLNQNLKHHLSCTKSCCFTNTPSCFDAPSAHLSGNAISTVNFQHVKWMQVSEPPRVAIMLSALTVHDLYISTFTRNRNNSFQQVRKQRTYNVIFKRVRETIVEVGK
jgi:hypothetical protein